MILYTNKEQSSNLLKFSKEDNYIVNQKNSIVYSSLDKGISIEYIIDKILINIKALVIFEKLESDEIALIFSNDTAKTIVFNINNNDFSIRKLENFIKLICLKKNISTIFFLENSKIIDNIKLPKSIKINLISREIFRRTVKKAPKLKNNQNKVVFLLVFLVITFSLSFLTEKSFIYLTKNSGRDFDKQYALLLNKQNELETELAKYENLTQNLREIKVADTFNDYLIFAKEIEQNNNLQNSNGEANK